MSALLGVLLGGVIGVSGSIIPIYLEGHRETKRAKGIVAAYLRGLLMISKARGQVELGRKVLEAWKTNPDFRFTIWGSDYFAADPMMQNVANQVAFLPAEDAADVVSFMMILIAVRIDLQSVENGKFWQLPVESRIATLTWDIAPLGTGGEAGRGFDQASLNAPPGGGQGAASGGADELARPASEAAERRPTERRAIEQTLPRPP